MSLLAPTLEAFFTDYPEAVVIPMPALNGCAVRASAYAGAG
jgi:hypothetical protein